MKGVGIVKFSKVLKTEYSYFSSMLPLAAVFIKSHAAHGTVVVKRDTAQNGKSFHTRGMVLARSWLDTDTDTAHTECVIGFHTRHSTVNVIVRCGHGTILNSTATSMSMERQWSVP